MIRILSCLLVCVSVTAPVCAQVLIHAFAGDSEGDLLGYALAQVGDLDADGKPEFAIGIPRDDAPWIDSGRVLVCSGATGAVVLNLVGPTPGEEFGYSLAGMGDLDLDGVPDLAVGSRRWSEDAFYRPGRVRILSGANGSLLREIRGLHHDEEFGACVAALGDVNGDGRPDLAISAPRDYEGRGRVVVVSGADGSEVFAIAGSGPNAFLGAALDDAGDVDADGIRDLVIGSYGDSTGLVDRAGAMFVVRGTDGTQIHVMHGDYPVMQLGESVAGAGDVDGDGHAEILVGASLHDEPGLENAGLVRLVSGASGAVLRTWLGATAQQRLGTGLVGGADLNGDGVFDVLAGCRLSAQGAGRVRAFSGADGSQLLSIDGWSDADQFGATIRFLGDLDGDGRSEFGAGAPTEDPNGSASGRLGVWGACSAPVSYCTGKVNSLGCVPDTFTTGSATASGPDDFVVSARNLVNQSNGMMIWARDRNATPFAGGTLCILPPVHRTVVVNAGGSPTGVRDCSGVLSFHFTHAYAVSRGIVPGDVVTCQFWARDVFAPDGTGVSLSNGLEFRWCP